MVKIKLPKGTIPMLPFCVAKHEHLTWASLKPLVKRECMHWCSSTMSCSLGQQMMFELKHSTWSPWAKLPQFLSSQQRRIVYIESLHHCSNFLVGVEFCLTLQSPQLVASKMKFCCSFLLVLLFGFISRPCLCKENTERMVKANENMKDSKHGIKMGQVFEGCDDAKVRH